MLIKSIESYILIEWIEEGAKITYIPNETIHIESGTMKELFKKHDPSGLYCIKRKKQDENYLNFVTAQRNNLIKNSRHFKRCNISKIIKVRVAA
jgi:hypothetical protein